LESANKSKQNRIRLGQSDLILQCFRRVSNDLQQTIRKPPAGISLRNRLQIAPGLLDESRPAPRNLLFSGGGKRNCFPDLLEERAKDIGVSSLSERGAVLGLAR